MITDPTQPLITTMTVATKLKYLTDTYVDEDESLLLHYGQDDRGTYLVLNQTIFYPQGGGQPSDVGSIQCGEERFDVNFVGFRDGQVLHYIYAVLPNLDEYLGKTCVLRLDKARRIKHARLHTAGHLIAGIIDAQRGSMRAMKGFHFEEGPYVEFAGEPGDGADSLLADLQAKVDRLIADAPQVSQAQVSLEELQQRCWIVPPNLPSDKPLRTITIHSLDPVPCGGTHVGSLSEVGSVNVVKMKTRKGVTKISYRIGDC